MTKYADDVVILLSISRNTNVNIVLTEEIQNMENWYCGKGLALNQDKTKIMFLCKQARITMPLTIFPFVSQLEILGIIYKPHLK